MLYSTGSNATRSWPGRAGRTLLANRIARLLSSKAAAKAQEARLLALLVVASIAVALSLCDAAAAGEISVSNDAELLKTLRGAKRGDTVIIAPGTYKGDIYVENLEGVTIRSADTANRAVIQGGIRGIQLVRPVDVTLQSLVFSRQLQGGITIDDGEARDTPARGIRIENVSVLNIVEKGNHDGIKLSGVQDVVIRNVVVEGWGTEGSAIDFVGVHRALIENSVLRHLTIGLGGSGIRVKGGSKANTIRANRVELPIGKARAIQAGGKTSAEFFRFADGDEGYEAADVVIEGNVVSGGASAFSWVNIDGGIVHHNLAFRPGTWVLRILNENPGDQIVETQNGQFHDNRVVFNDTDKGFNRPVNVGDKTLPETFSFARNIWINLAKPTAAGSKPKLPVEEVDGIYGATPIPNVDLPQVWDMPWGKWVVNATTVRATVDLRAIKDMKLAAAGASATFDPLADPPLSGDWVMSDPGTSLTLQPMSQAILIATTR
jgi:hypothetical protein